MYMTFGQATRFLNEELGIPISEATLRKLAAQKRVPHTKLSKRVLFDVDSLGSWIKAHAVPAAAR